MNWKYAAIGVLTLLLVMGVVAIGIWQDGETDPPTQDGETDPTNNSTETGPALLGDLPEAYQPISIAPPGPLNESRFEDTLSLLDTARTANGGYRLLHIHNRNLYATHYATLAAETANVDRANTEQTHQWLHAILDREFRNASGARSTQETVSLSDYYFALNTLNTTGATPHNQSSLIAQIDDFRTPDGGYCYAIGRDNRTCTGSGTPVGTFYAVKSLDILNGSIHDETSAWIRTALADKDQFTGPQTLPVAHKLLVSSDTAAIDRQSIPAFDATVDRLEQVLEELSPDGGHSISVWYTGDRVSELLGIELGVSEQRLAQTIGQRQRTDGGFSIFEFNTSDMVGTYYGASLVANYPETFDQGELAQFLQVHFLDDGGASVSPRRSASLSSAYYATEIRRLVSLTDDPAQWLRESVASAGRPSVRQAFYLHELATTSGMSSPLARATMQTFLRDGSFSEQDLPRLSWAVHVLEELSASYNESRVRNHVLGLQNDDGGFGSSQSRIDSTYHAVKILTLSGGVPSAMRPELRSLIAGQRIDGSGYAARRGNQTAEIANLRSTYQSVAVLQLLGEAVPQPAAVRSFVEDTRHPDGGFRLTTQEVDTVSKEATNWALKTLALLKQGPTVETTAAAAG